MRLAANDGPADVVVELVSTAPAPVERLDWHAISDEAAVWRAETPQGSWLRLRYESPEGSADFVVDAGGTHVWAWLSDGVVWEEVVEGLIGPIFSCVMSHRGATCLHAAVLQVHGRVVALAGAKGAGKSTTALELVRGGASVVSDDVAVLGEVDGRVGVAAGQPRLRVRREVADALGISYDELVPMWVHEERRPAKRYAEVPTGPGAADEVVALDAIYVLGAREADAVSARRLTAVEALPRLMTLRHMSDVAAADAHARDFAALAGVAARVPVFDLMRPDDVRTIGHVAAVVGDVESAA